VNKKNRIELDREILSSVKKEMDRPRLAASVREDMAATAALATRARADLAAKA
jgi:hypothetical protein